MQDILLAIPKMFESLLVGVSIAAIPGPIFFELIRRTIAKGFLNGAQLALGEFSGNLLLLLLIFLGSSQLLASNTAKIILFFIGGCILFKIGISALQIKSGEDTEQSYTENSGNRSSFLTGFSIAVTSPIVIALWISLSGSYLIYFTEKYYAFFHIFLIAFGFLLFFLPLALIIHKTRRRILPKYVVLLSRISGIILIVYGVSFFYQITKLI